MTGGIFISYRREDSRHAAGRLVEQLGRTFGRDQLFMDVDAIEPGLDFVEVLNQKLASCNVLLALIGPGWLDATDDNGRRRLDNPSDFVRLEVEAALRRSIRVIPVLLDDANLPKKESLPPGLKPLARRQTVSIAHERFTADAEGLVRSLARVVEPNLRPASAAGAPRPLRLLAWPLVIFAVIAALFALALKSGDPSRLPSALIGRAAPEVTLPPLEGLSDGVDPIGGFSTADLAKGEVSVVNFWASWCAPCVQEHPLLVALKERTGVRIYGVNYKDQTANARRFLGRYGNPFTTVGVDNGRAAIEWGVIAMPETFVVDGRGVVVYKHTGPISAEALETKIIPAIRAAQGH